MPYIRPKPYSYRPLTPAELDEAWLRWNIGADLCYLAKMYRVPSRALWNWWKEAGRKPGLQRARRSVRQALIKRMRALARTELNEIEVLLAAILLLTDQGIGTDALMARLERAYELEEVRAVTRKQPRYARSAFARSVLERRQVP